MDWSFHTDAPIYTQLVRRLRGAIASGVFAPGERLPSVRELALEAAVNPNTVQRAFQELERTGLVYAQRANGRVCTEDPEVIRRARDQLAREETERYLREMRLLGCGGEEILARIRERLEKGEEKDGDF